MRNRTAELTRVNEELAQAQTIAEEANLGKTRFLAAAGHDILQPLNAARLYCSSLIEKAGKGGIGEAATNIESSLESVETILGAVLDISRLDAGAMKPADSSLRAGQADAPDRHRFPAAWRQRKNLKLVIVPSSLVVRTDRNLLRRLIQNLVSNAIKYTRNGKILVGVRRRDGCAELQVIDTGIGIAADKLRLFSASSRGSTKALREAQGLGLGLSIVDRIARVLRLEIRIASEKGHGTRFSVIIPTTDAAELRHYRRPDPRCPTAVALNGLSVLCIDNDPRILDGMRLLLEGWGCEVRTASGSRELDQPGTAGSPAGHHPRRLPSRRRERARCDQKAARLIRVGRAGHSAHGRPIQRGARCRRRDRCSCHQQAGQARSFALHRHAIPPNGARGGMSDRLCCPSSPCRTRPFAMASGVRRSKSQIVGFSSPPAPTPHPRRTGRRDAFISVAKRADDPLSAVFQALARGQARSQMQENAFSPARGEIVGCNLAANRPRPRIGGSAGAGVSPPLRGERIFMILAKLSHRKSKRSGIHCANPAPPVWSALLYPLAVRKRG